MKIKSETYDATKEEAIAHMLLESPEAEVYGITGSDDLIWECDNGKEIAKYTQGCIGFKNGSFEKFPQTTGNEDYDYLQRTVDVPDHDCDVHLVFPSGEVLAIQARPSNASEGYNGSLDFCLPKNTCVTNWEGDDMKSSKPYSNEEHERFAKQLVVELP